MDNRSSGHKKTSEWRKFKFFKTVGSSFARIVDFKAVSKDNCFYENKIKKKLTEIGFFWFSWIGSFFEGFWIFIPG